MPVAKTTLPRSGLEISRIGLGFAHAHTMPAPDRMRLIHRALDLGITHIDTSRFYSDGLSETTLGTALRENRGSLTITTKFGLLPTPLIASLGPLAAPARKVRSLFHKLRVHAYPQRSYTPATMQKALHDSLRALRTDYLDIYCLHEPLHDSVIADDLFAALQHEKHKGTIRHIGVSGAEIDAVVTRFGDSLDVIQSAEASWNPVRFVPDITHSLFSNVIRQQNAGLRDSDARTLLESALTRRPRGAVIVQTRNPAHLEQIVSWADGK